MGGYFGAYVVINVLALAGAVWRRRTREAVVAAALFGGVTVAAALVPQSHELRYYMHWMLLLVSLNLVLWAREARRAVGVVAVSALAVVTWSTSAAYLHASGGASKRSSPSASTGPRDRVRTAGRAPLSSIARPSRSSTRRPSTRTRATRCKRATTDADCNGARRVP